MTTKTKQKKTTTKAAKTGPQTTNTTTENVEQTTKPEVQSMPATPPNITVEDLKAVVAIVNTATSRGAFKANELTTVGAVYDKLSSFLAWYDAYIAKAQQKTETEEKVSE